MFPIATQLEYQSSTAVTNVIGKSFLWDFSIGDFVYSNGKPKLSDSLSGTKVWIEKVIRTQKNKYLVYANSQYGVNSEDLIGSTLNSSFVKNELEREIKDALENHPDIKSITLFQMSQVDEILNISFNVFLNSGTSFAKGFKFNV